MDIFLPSLITFYLMIIGYVLFRMMWLLFWASWSMWAPPAFLESTKTEAWALRISISFLSLISLSLICLNYTSCILITSSLALSRSSTSFTRESTYCVFIALVFLILLFSVSIFSFSFSSSSILFSMLSICSFNCCSIRMCFRTSASSFYIISS